MENMIDFPWYRNHGGLQFDYNEQFVVQKELFLENFLRLTSLFK